MADPDNTKAAKKIRPEKVPEADERAKLEEMVHSAPTGQDAEAQARIDLLVQLKNLRGRYALAAFVLMVIWLLVVAILLVLTGWERIPFELSDTVLTTLVAGATANIVGLVGSVMWSLFPRGGFELPPPRSPDEPTGY
ncbi:MAG: hypothetical protein IH983_01835 [Planctomycetes bacterium]|nr:hypothetical protein [Planctomycetota bacterium]